MQNKKSDYYKGSYWPPEAPAINFKPIPIKDFLEKRYFDPTVRIPLLQIIFHDSVLITNHWGSDMLKYKDQQQTMELIQLLYLSPPLYNLNRSRLAEKREEILDNYRFFSPLHREYGDKRLLSFRWLDKSKLVQEVSYEGGLTMVCNFSETEFTAGKLIMPARSIAAVETGEKVQIYSPD